MSNYAAINSTRSRMESTESDITSTGFSPSEYLALTENIAQNISEVQKNRQRLDQIIKIIGGPKDTTDGAKRVEAKQMQVTTNGTVQSIKKDIIRLKAITKHGDKQQTIHVDRLTTHFQEIIEIYSETQKKIATKMKQHVLVTASQQDDISNDANNANSESDNINTQQQQINVQKGLQLQHQLIQERHERLHQIEVDIVDINKIMLELHSMVQVQGESISNIEDNVHHAADNVEDGRAQLAEAAKNLKKSRKKYIILVILVVIIAAIVIGIIVSHLKKK